MPLPESYLLGQFRQAANEGRVVKLFLRGGDRWGYATGVALPPLKTGGEHVLRVRGRKYLVTVALDEVAAISWHHGEAVDTPANGEVTADVVLAEGVSS